MHGRLHNADVLPVRVLPQRTLGPCEMLHMPVSITGL